MKFPLFIGSIVVLGASTALAGEDADKFASLDTDASGGLSLEEVQAKDSSVTADGFASFDADASGELDETEFAAWKASKTDLESEVDLEPDADLDSE